MALGKITSGTHGATSHASTLHDASGHRRKKGWATADNRAKKCCRRRIAKPVCDVGAWHEHLWTSHARRNSAGRIVANRKTGARRLQSAQRARCEMRSQATAWGCVAHGNIPRRRGRPKHTLGDGRRPGNEALPADSHEKRFATWARGATIFGPRGEARNAAALSQAAQTERNSSRTQCGTVRGEGAIRTHGGSDARNNTPGGRGARKMLGDGGRPGNVATPTWNRANAVRGGGAARASVDIAAPRKTTYANASHGKTPEEPHEK